MRNKFINKQLTRLCFVHETAVANPKPHASFLSDTLVWQEIKEIEVKQLKQATSSSSKNPSVCTWDVLCLLHVCVLWRRRAVGGRRENTRCFVVCLSARKLYLSERVWTQMQREEEEDAKNGHNRGEQEKKQHDEEEEEQAEEEEEETEYVVLDLDEVFNGAAVPANCPYTLTVSLVSFSQLLIFFLHDGILAQQWFKVWKPGSFAIPWRGRKKKLHQKTWMCAYVMMMMRRLLLTAVISEEEIQKSH